MKKIIVYLIVALLTTICIPTVQAEEVSGIVNIEISDPEDEGMEPLGVLPGESSRNIREIINMQSYARGLKFRTRIWKLNPMAGTNNVEWYIVSLQTDALHNDVTANLIGHQIMVWDNTGCQVQYYKITDSMSNYVPIWYQPFNSWEEDRTVGIPENDPYGANTWGWFDDNNRFDSESWNFYTAVINGGKDVWGWDEGDQVRRGNIYNFETVLLVGGIDLSFNLKYIYENVVDTGAHRSTNILLPGNFPPMNG